AAAAQVEVGVTSARRDLERATTVARQARQDEETEAETSRVLAARHADCPCGGGLTGEEPPPAAGPRGGSERSVDPSAISRVHDRAVAAVEGWRDAVALHEAAASRFAVAHATALSAAAEAGFDSLDDAAAAVR
ncbi:hypothetical protein, partial [Knoellia aerolata]|uniref:hypothetical protein n=1 Tax=Knoellia aerolata TaxID=442954 RepID=UPI00056C4037